MSDGADDAYRQAMKQEGEQLANPREAIREELLELCANGVYSTEEIDALLLRYVLASAPVDGDLREAFARKLFEQRTPPYSWEEAEEAELESDAGTLRSICFDDADAILALLPARTPEPDAATEAFKFIAECFEAAVFEGLAERVMEGDQQPGSLSDLVNRRLLPGGIRAREEYEKREAVPPAPAQGVPERFKHFAPDGGKPKMPEGWEGKIEIGKILDQLYELTGADDGERQSQIGGLLESYAEMRYAKRPISEAPLDTAVIVYGFGGYEVAHYNTGLKAWVSCNDHRRVLSPKYWWPLPGMLTKEEMLGPEPVEAPKPKRGEIFISFSLEGTHATIDGRVVTAKEALDAIGKPEQNR